MSSNRGGANSPKKASGAVTPIQKNALQWNATADMATLSALLPLVQESGMYQKGASCVREYSYQEDKNFRFRPSMEDSKKHNPITTYSLLREGQDVQ